MRIIKRKGKSHDRETTIKAEVIVVEHDNENCER
jgi:hypothetical protein